MIRRTNHVVRTWLGTRCNGKQAFANTEFFAPTRRHSFFFEDRMAGPRLSSVYDFSSLRLHPDGSRVAQNTSKNLRPGRAASVVRDPRGNWIARDAAGLPTAKRYSRVGQDADGEEIDLEEADKEPAPRKSKGKAKARPGRKYDPRPAKRQKFMEDFEFLTPVTPSSSSSEHPLPSSDLLKAIHYFASTYYHERGQLLNVTREYRIRRKENKLRRLEEQKAREASGEHDEGEKTIKPVRRGGRIKGAGDREYPKDMYKIMDGSALVAIGMLMQEYVARMLEIRIPDGWEEMIKQTYGETQYEPPDSETGVAYDAQNETDTGDVELAEIRPTGVAGESKSDEDEDEDEEDGEHDEEDGDDPDEE
ncbi:hypothetical protein LshimejAT787_0111450 [Lyophyllum shimeji]|uniref:Uncharacterized protein n=1 Tax=Lyophyllum shimeji TaxID=47721 RepID=A0A9P3PF02_LYOSH|nr:hypothetical protein LshimejAT787_0111450 [Lyophyllum shimeji]